MSSERRTGRPYAVPFGLSVLSVTGLVVALVGEGVWNVVAWGLVGSPAVAVLATWLWPRGERA